MKIRHEEYTYKAMPFCFNTNLIRTSKSVFPDMNWHEGMEIQVCNKGKGSVFVNGTEHFLDEENIIVINSKSIHYTITDEFLDYSALIVNPDFCKDMGIDYECLMFDSVVKNEKISQMLINLHELHKNEDLPYKTASETVVLLKILIELAKNHSKKDVNAHKNSKSFAYVKSTINYIRMNFAEKILLDDIARELCVDKYYLTREFKKNTGKTIVQYINSYRCNMAADLILSGKNVSEAANACGFDNYSYFTKTFKRNIGVLPSKIGS